MQSVLSRVWTRVTVSISYDDNHDTTGTSNVFILATRTSHKTKKINSDCSLNFCEDESCVKNPKMDKIETPYN